MITSADYPGLAQRYVAGARAILAPIAAATGERGVSRPKALSARADELLPVSSDLNRAAGDKLKSSVASERMQAEAQLLSKAITDLEVSSQLIRAAQDEQAGAKDLGPTGERAYAGNEDSDAVFDVLLGASARSGQSTERGFVMVGDRDSALKELTDDVTDLVSQLIERAAGASQKSVDGILGIGLAKLAKGASAAVFDIANLLGAGEKYTRLAEQARDFVHRAYDAIRALVGDTLLGMGMDKLTSFLADLKSRERAVIDQALNKLYDTPALTKGLRKVLSDTNADIPKLSAAHDAVLGLNTEHQARMDMVGRIQTLLKLVPLLSAFGLPEAQLALGIGHLLIASYVVFATADYLDADNVRKLNLIPGLKTALQNALA